MKIGQFTLSYNTAPWIKAFWKATDGLIDHRVMIQGKSAMKRENKELADGEDNTVEIVEKNFPDVDIHYTDSLDMKSLWNYGIELLQGCDFVFRFDSDEIFTPLDWKRMIAYVRGTDPQAVDFNFGKDSVIYYHDLDRGVQGHSSFFETRGINTKYRLQNWGAFPGADTNLTKFNLLCHHVSNWKGIYSQDAWANNQIPDHNGKYERDFEKSFGGWKKAPLEIRTLFK